MNDSTNLYYELLKQAQKDKLDISKETLLKTQKLYQSSLKDLIKKLDGKETYDQQFIKAQIKNLKYEFEGMNRKLEEIAVDGLNRSSSLALNTNLDFYKFLNDEYKLGIEKDTLESLLGTNKSVLDKIISGGLYKDNKSLSERIWNYSEKNINDVQDILLKGIIKKQPIKEITDSLKAYTGGGDSKVGAINRAYGKMNSNALRLVRTSLNHAFVETMKDTNRKNPFVEGYKWTLSSAHSERMNGRTDECDEFAAHEEGLGEGVFKKDTLPGNHCNCLCIITPYVTKSLEEIGTEINKWIKGEENAAIDEWAESRGYKPEKTSSKEDNKTEKTPKKEFIEAKTIKEANEYAKNVIGIKNASYGKVDIRTANEWNKCLFETLNKFPELKGNFTFTGSIQERNKFGKKDEEIFKEYLEKFKSLNARSTFKRLTDEQYEEQIKDVTTKWIKKQFSGAGLKDTLAYSTNYFKQSKGIMVNDKFGADYDNFVEVLKRNVVNKFHPIGGNTVRSVADHEIGHQLDNLLSIKDNKEIQELFNSMTTSEITDKLSKYSWDNDNPNRYSEFIAEGWSEYCNSGTPRNVASQIGETIERIYKEKYGG